MSDYFRANFTTFIKLTHALTLPSRSFLLTQIAERSFQDETLGLIVNTPVFRILVQLLDGRGPRVWFRVFVVLSIALFGLVAWATLWRHGGRPTVIAAPIIGLVILAILAIRELAQMRVYRNIELRHPKDEREFVGLSRYYR